MRILVNDLAASKSGALTILRSLYTYISEYDSDDEWIFLLSGEYLRPRKSIEIIVVPEVKKSWFHKLKFDFLTGKRLIDRLQPDYVLSMQNIITFGIKQRQGVYIHQSIPFQNIKRFSFLKKNEFIYAVYQYLIGSIIKLSARKADDVFVQTKWMKRAVCEKAKITEETITVVPVETNRYETTGVNQETNRFFFPTGFEALYKNHQCIYDACEILDTDGIEDYSVILTISPSKRMVSKKIRFVGHLDNEQMQEEYQRSVLIFPSYIETVGLPLIEAAHMGSLILAADCEYAREALEGYENAIFFNPFDPHELARRMKEIIQSSGYSRSVGRIERSHTWSSLLNTAKRGGDSGKRPYEW